MPDDLPTRDRLLDAAVEVAADHGLARLSVGDVAKRAGLSRQTLYKHFPSKDALVAEAVLREAASLAATVQAAEEAASAASGGDPRASLAATIAATLQAAREHPLLDRLVRTEPEALLPLLIGDTGQVSSAVRALIADIVAERLPDLDPAGTGRAADLLARLLVSYAVSAPDDPPEVVGAFVAGALVDGLAATVEHPPT